MFINPYKLYVQSDLSVTTGRKKQQTPCEPRYCSIASVITSQHSHRTASSLSISFPDLRFSPRSVWSVNRRRLFIPLVFFGSSVICLELSMQTHICLSKKRLTRWVTRHQNPFSDHSEAAPCKLIVILQVYIFFRRCYGIFCMFTVNILPHWPFLVVLHPEKRRKKLP